MTAFSDSARFFQNRRVACRVYDGLAEVITLDQPVRQHRLNRTATRLWELASDGATTGELVAGILARFEVEPARAASDVANILPDLVSRGILVVDGEADGGAT